jgi:REP element-mobilizing transposase RayT
MARPPRISFKGALYLITQRGNNRTRIVVDDNDRQHFLNLISIYMDLYECLLYAYVLMEDHLHLILETRQPNISRFMHAINTAYTIGFNKKYQKEGHLFQSRYKSIVMEKEKCLVELSRYIHLNPVRQKLAKKPELYQWSSYANYIGERQDRLVSTTPILSRFGNNKNTQILKYREFVESGINRNLKRTIRKNVQLIFQRNGRKFAENLYGGHP